MDVQIEVVTASVDRGGPGKPFRGPHVLQLPGTCVGLTRLGPGAATPWHHHGACNFFGYVICSVPVLEAGRGGRERTRLVAGQFLRIPSQCVHWDLNETSEIVLVATVCVGEGPMSTLVESPVH